MYHLINKLVSAFADSYKGEGQYLTTCLAAAVPLWQLQFADWTPEQRQAMVKELNNSDLCLRLEYVLHRGPKEGDSAKAFNDLAKTIALLSFCPGGVEVFGTRWRYQQRLRLKENEQ